MGSSVEPAIRLVLRARFRLTSAALAEAAAAPLAGFLLLAAALLAVARGTGRGDLPRGVLEAAGLLALLAVAARVAKGVPGTAAAALHLDRALAAGERFTTVVETAESDPALAEWAARGALARAGGEGLARALAFRPPAALLPLLLAATLVAGLALLPGASAPAARAPDGGTAAAGPGASAGGTGPGAAAGRPGTAAGAASPAAAGPGPDAAEVVRRLEGSSAAKGSEAMRRELAAAREALSRGDGAAAREAIARALAAGGLDAGSLAGAGPSVSGATGGGAAARGDGTPAAGEESFRALPVPLRAREAVSKYFGKGGTEH